MNFNDNEEFLKIAIIESAVEAQLVAGILDEEGIPYIIRSYHDTAYDGLFQFQKGWGEIQVPASYKQEVLGIIEDIRSRTYEDEEWEEEPDEDEEWEEEPDDDEEWEEEPDDDDD